ncbi:MAG: fibro-slime domain-containing protein, partial [Fibrobacteraceae bacterium]|nr:fibro-slime domain-containing protein [Fibrobacteraceae bacterium]
EEDGGSPYYHPELDTGVNIDFGSAYNGTAKTEKIIDGVSYNGCQGLHLGMVEDSLSKDGLPIRNLTTFPEDSCTTADHLNGWFIPDTLVTKNGTAYTNTSCYDIPLALDNEGFWLADYIEVENDSSKIGFFPADNFKFLDSNETVVNPLFDSINGGYRGWHNYSFSMKVQAQFVYVKGQYFEFRGDDDVWVFINGKLVVDIGGVHSPIEGFVNLDTLGLTEGDTYPFRIFFSERSASGSNFKMRTSIDLQTERSYYYQSSTTDEGLPEYKILQLIREEALSCDYTNGSATVKSAPSSFVLSGGGLASPVTLASGVNYGGITIADDYASFTIDTAAIVASRSLAPGTYTLTFSLASDASLSSKITFTINTYPLPTIAFADSLWNEIDPDTVTLGQYAFVPYQVNVIVYYMGVPCDTGCDELLNLSTLDSLIFQDAAGNSIDSVTLSGGRASFFVVGQGTIFAGAFDVFGSTVADTITWKNINLEKPPVPVPAGGKIFDVNGDGVADSLFLSYDSPITGDDAPDTLAWLFGDSLYHYLSKSDVAANLASDSIVVLTGDSLVSKLFTGSSENVAYSGSYKTTFYKVLTDTLTATIDTVPFNVTGKIADKIGPVLVNAIVTPKSENVYQLSLTFSESIESNNIGFDSLFEFRVWRSGIESSSSLYPVSGSRSANRYEIYYSSRNGALPSVGDSVRFVPRSGALDLSANGPSENNRWVRIVGEQYIVVESTTLFSFNPENTAGVEKSAAIVPFKVPLESTLKEAEKDVGLPGFLVRYDLSELSLSSDTPKDKIYLAYDVSYFTNLGAYVNSSTGMVLCTDSVFNGDCTANPGNVYLAWNLRSNKGRLVATGAYIAKLDLKIGVIGGDRKKKDVSAVWGVRRNKE